MSDDSVAVPNAAYTARLDDWHMVDTLWGGTRAMRAAGKKYLPMMPDEEQAAWKNRIAQSVLTNVYKDTVLKLASKPFKNPVILKNDVPPIISRYRDDIDGQGTSLDVFARNVAESAIHKGVSYIFVDYPPADPDVTKRDEIELGLRPYAVNYDATQIIGWRATVNNGRKVLTQVRIAEEIFVDDGEFNQKVVNRIRVLEPGRYRTFELKESNDQVNWVQVDERQVLAKGQPLNFIPLIAVYANQTGFMMAEPALLDVAFLNVAHWQSDSDQRNILHIARVPVLFSSGLEDDPERPITKLAIGSATFIRGNSGADLKFVEHSGKGIEAGRQDLADLETRMAELGMNMLVKGRSGTATATARVLDQAEADSPLSMFVREMESALENMLDYFGVFLGLGQDAGGSVELFKDFSLTMRDVDDIKELGQMRARGDISQLTYWNELKRRGLLSDDFDNETEVDLLDLEEPNRVGITEAELEQGNMAGDETGKANGHRHVLQANGWTNLINGHRHKWEPTGMQTGQADEHFHVLGGQNGQT